MSTETFKQQEAHSQSHGKQTKKVTLNKLEINQNKSEYSNAALKQQWSYSLVYTWYNVYNNQVL